MTLQNRLATKMAAVLDVPFATSDSLTDEIRNDLLDGRLDAALIHSLDGLAVEEITDNGLIFAKHYELIAIPRGSGAFVFNPDRTSVGEAYMLANYLLK